MRKTSDHLSLAVRAFMCCQDVLNNVYIFYLFSKSTEQVVEEWHSLGFRRMYIVMIESIFSQEEIGVILRYT